jgi:prolipoprotein diacylglyceryltransferase
VEFVKEYQTLTSDSPLTMGQYLSIPFFLTGVYLLVYTWRHRNQGSPHPSGKGACTQNCPAMGKNKKP